jgi:hypothetical protein
MFRAWGVKDDLRGPGGGFAVSDDYAAKQEAKGEGDNGSATGREPALGQQNYDVGQHGVDALR